MIEPCNIFTRPYCPIYPPGIEWVCDIYFDTPTPEVTIYGKTREEVLRKALVKAFNWDITDPNAGPPQEEYGTPEFPLTDSGEVRDYIAGVD